MWEEYVCAGYFLLEVHPELGVAPGLFGGIPITHVIDKLTREEYTAADLPGYVISGGEEMGINHVDFFPNISRVVGGQ